MSYYPLISMMPKATGFDPDAQAFITAASITNPTQQSAINQLVVDLKGYNIWTKFKAIYPFCGSTASQHKWNLKDPRDLDAAFRLQFINGWTHSANGATPNGIDGYADTKLSPSGQLSISSAHFSKYNRTNDLAGVKIDGVADGVPSFFQQNFSSANGYIGDGASLAAYTPTDTRGLITTTRTANNLIKVFRNSSQIAINNTTTITAIPIASPFIGARNNGGGVGQFYNTYQCAFASIGDGLTDTQAANFYTAVQAYQTTLGRSIGTQTVSDADAQAFVTNAGIVDQVEANAINNLVIGLKADGLWTKMQAIYPFVGGTASQHTWNLRNTAQYQANWIGGVTHSNLGVKFNGMNGYGGTGLNFSTALASSNSNSIGYYSGTNLSETMPDPIAMGAYDNVANFALIGKNNTTFLSRLNAASISHSTITMKGFFSASRQSSTLTDIYLNGSQVATGNSGGVLPNFACYLGNINIANAPYGSGYILNDMRFAYISDGLNDTEMTNLYNRVQTFQTTLGRQV